MGKWQRIMYQPNLPLGEDGKRVTACKEHRELSKRAAKQGMVLLKNDRVKCDGTIGEKLLPIRKGTKLALFGKGTFDYVKGGGGSGEVTEEYIISLYKGLQMLDGHVEICEKLAGFYRENVENQYKNGAIAGMTVEPEISDEICKDARAFTDTAVITICRFSGEGSDRKSTYDKQENDEKVIFEDGDFYLSHAEKAMIEKVKKYFDKIIVVMNIGGMSDTDWFADDDGIQAVFMAWQAGMEGGLAAAELLCGYGNPSGKLADTFAKRLEDYPSTYGFHQSDDFVDYKEDIYVGYRYFETIPGALEKVNYPFGFGLSYTTFDINVTGADTKDDKITVTVKVKNTGETAGKEVIQLYVNAPDGKLGKATKSLMAFKKTKELAPGEETLIELSFNVAEMASYDDLGKICKSAYILEKGTYRFFVGNSVRHGEYIDFVYEVNEDKAVKQLSQRIAPSLLEERMLSDGSFEKLSVWKKDESGKLSVTPDSFGNIAPEPNDKDFYELPYMDKPAADGNVPEARFVPTYNLWRCPHKEGIVTFDKVAEGEISLDEFVAQLTDEELAYLLGGQPNTGVANTCGMGNIPDYGVPSLMTADGPAGLRIDKKCGINTTTWPCVALLACSWDEELLYEIGVATAMEVKENNIGVWLAPAVNIHRSPLCGRNFEYYSEDPYLAGMLAASVVKGVQTQHIAATVKHFAMNNKETNRKDSDSRVSERAAREIYLKVFEIIVKNSQPWAIMSSYNIINGHRASECRELLTDILRGEWGFEGMVTTDWWTFGEAYKEVKAGNDLKMPYGNPDRLLMAKEKGLLSREEMEICGKRILTMILRMD